jgi:hypothetical protein
MASVIFLAACAAPSQSYLDAYRRGCTAGDQAACRLIPATEARVNEEKQHAAADFGEGVLKVLAFSVLVLGAAAGGYAAGVESSRPVYHPTPVRYSAPVYCTSMDLGGGMVTTSCN